MILFSTAILSVFAQNPNCQKASTPFETAICTDESLARADEKLNASYRFLLSSCQVPNLKNLQRSWLSEMNKLASSGTKTNVDLAGEYAKRNQFLDDLVRQCGEEHNVITPAIVESIRDPNYDFNIPYVEMTSNESARRINDWIFNRLFEIRAPEKISDGLKDLPEIFRGPGVRPTTFVDYSVIRNDGRLLVLELTVEGCGAYCERSTDQFSFDARNGRQIESVDLFTNDGAKHIAELLQARRLKRGRAILKRIKINRSAEQDEMDMYDWCLREWAQDGTTLWPFSLERNGQIRFVVGGCSAHATRPWNALDNLDEVFPVSALKAYLSDYGKNVLLREGETQEPAPPLNLNCEKELTEADANKSQSNLKVASISAGEKHHLLLQSDGRLWAWGWNAEGELGTEATSSYGPAGYAPVLVGNDFAVAEASQGFSAAIRNDGSLWTWGDDYEGRLGDGGEKKQERPVRIGDDFVRLVLKTNGGLALKRDATLWEWGGAYSETEKYRLVPRQIDKDVAEIGLGFVLKKDGSIWALDAENINGKPQDRQLIGSGFTHLVAPRAQLAVKPDGSLWAWGDSRRGTLNTPDTDEGSLAEVGRDFVKVSFADPGFLVALKADGSLWATQQRGRVTRVDPVACGFIDTVAFGDPTTWDNSEKVFVLALRHDGTLVAWGNWKYAKDWLPSTQMFTNAPVVIGTGFARLFQVGQSIGALNTHVVALRTDGTVWVWEKPSTDSPPSIEGLLLHVPFPESALSKISTGDNPPAIH